MTNKEPFKLPVPQSELAAYMGISGSQYSMTSTGRHGNRQFSSVASKKLTDLFAVHLQVQASAVTGPAVSAIDERSKQDAAKLAGILLKDAQLCEYRSKTLQKRLEEMILKANNDRHWLNTLDHLLGITDPTDKAAEWFRYQHMIVTKRVQKNGLVAQAKLEMRIALEKARARELLAVAEKLPGL